MTGIWTSSDLPQALSLIRESSKVMRRSGCEDGAGLKTRPLAGTVLRVDQAPVHECLFLRDGGAGLARAVEDAGQRKRLHDLGEEGPDIRPVAFDDDLPCHDRFASPTVNGRGENGMNSSVAPAIGEGGIDGKMGRPRPGVLLW